MSIFADVESGVCHGNVRGDAQTISLFQVRQWRLQRRR